VVRTPLPEAKLSKQANPDPTKTEYRIVKLASGAYSVHSLAHGETFHPVVGPVAEAQALYVRQFGLLERLRKHTGPFVVWDVGLGAAANALAVLESARNVPCSIQMLSFDHTLAPLSFALEHPQHLEYLRGHEEQLSVLLSNHQAHFQEGSCAITWNVHLADFPSLLNRPEAVTLAKPDLIMFDAFSPARNPAMWTLPLFTNLFRLLAPQRPCVLPTYSRSTILRTTLLLAGFFVGVGHATGEKEETTVASNTLDYLVEPLDGRWLERVRRSNSAEPLNEAIYRQTKLSSGNWERLLSHPQFAHFNRKP
jgi:tRNA U34 5-methylaminomethyl-2-thiouridine-forming methyltransferase MnmC